MMIINNNNDSSVRPQTGVHTIVCRKLCIAYNVSLIMYRIANYVSQLMYHKLCIAYHVSHIMYR